MHRSFLISFSLFAATLAAGLSSSAPAAAQPPQVSGPTPLAAPVSDPITFVSVHDVKFGAGEYMAVWGANPQSSIAVQAFDASGAPLGAAPTYVGEQGIPSLAFDGTNFRVFWTNGNYDGAGPSGILSAVVAPDGTAKHWSQAIGTTQAVSSSAACASTGECAAVTFDASGVVGVRFDANGDPIDPAPVPIAPGGDAGVAWGNTLQIAHITSGYVVVWQYAPAPCELQVLDPTLAPVGPPVQIGDASSASCTIGGRDDRVLVAWGEQQTESGPLWAMRFDGTGAAMDAAPLSLGTGYPPTAVAATNGGFAIAANPEGLPPGPDATMMQIGASGQVTATTSLPVAGYQSGELWDPLVASDGTNVFVVGDTGARSSGAAGNDDPNYTPRRFLVGATGAVTLPATVLTQVYEAQEDPDSAWDGAGFLAAWTRGAPPVLERGLVGVDGSVQALPTVPSAAVQGTPWIRAAVASNGAGYGFVTGGAQGTEVAVAPTAAGVPSAATSVGQGNSETDVAMASDGHGYLAVYGYELSQPGVGLGWETEGRLFDATGTPLQTLSIGFSIFDFNTLAAVAWNGSTYAATSLDVFQPDGGAAVQDAFASFYDASGNLVAGPVSVTGLADGMTTSGSVVGEATVGCATGSCLFAWTTATGVFTRRFDAKGVPAGAAAPLAGTTGFRAPRLAWDGQEYVFAAALSKVGPHDVVTAWLDDNGQALGAGFTTVATAAVGSTVPLRLAADPSGHAEITYTRFTDQRAVGYSVGHATQAPDAGTDGGTEGDAGASPEAGPRPGAPDAGGDASQSNADGNAGGGSSSGCGCAIPWRSSPAFPAGNVALLAALLTLRRRRR